VALRGYRCVRGPLCCDLRSQASESFGALVLLSCYGQVAFYEAQRPCGGLVLVGLPITLEILATAPRSPVASDQRQVYQSRALVSNLAR